MKGKRWELPQKFRTIYWQNFALTASIVMLTLALLGASFFALSYAYAADERSDEMAQKASVVARLVASYASSGDVRDMREMAGVAASMTDVDFLVCSTEGSVLLTTDENLVDHVLTVPSDVMETALSGERYSARTTLGGIYESKRFVVGVPIESDIWTVGAVFAVTETGRLTTMWRAFFAMFLMTSVIVLLLSFVASAWVSMRQSRPIREMAAATRAFAEGNFDTRMHDYGAGEIGELASAFNAMADSLQETERQRREFIANISHELKTPMTSIAGYTDGSRVNGDYRGAVIDGCSVNGTFVHTGDRGNQFVGGLVGMQYKGAILNSSAQVDLSGVVLAGDLAEVGGLVGLNNRGLVANCWSDSNVYGSGSRENGNEGMAVVSNLVACNAGALVNCYASGDVTTKEHSTYAGMVSGWVTGIGKSYHCWYDLDSTMIVGKDTDSPLIVKPVESIGTKVSSGVNDELYRRRRGPQRQLRRLPHRHHRLRPGEHRPEDLDL